MKEKEQAMKRTKDKRDEQQKVENKRRSKNISRSWRQSK